LAKECSFLSGGLKGVPFLALSAQSYSPLVFVSTAVQRSAFGAAVWSFGPLVPQPPVQS
jgi:hypothetical protein